MAWRLQTNLDALWVKVFKGLYFPTGDFRFTSKGSRASWACSSILEGKDILFEGAFWNIGNGKNVRVWQDKWVP